MRANRDRYAVREMVGLFGVSRGAYYRWARRIRTAERADAGLTALIRKIALKRHLRYGSLRSQEEPRRACGMRVSRKKAARFMREQGLNVCGRRKHVPTTRSNHGLPVCANILDQQFGAEKPEEKWVSDITCLRASNAWGYLTTIRDLYDRKVIGRTLGDGMDSGRTVIPALEMAVGNRAASPGLLFHSDRGARCYSKTFWALPRLRCPDIRQNMSGKGNCWDNIRAGSFFKTLKREAGTLERRHSAAEVRQPVFMYIEAYYNRERPHSALDHASPDGFNSGEAA
jgi:putative transposase